MISTADGDTRNRDGMPPVMLEAEGSSHKVAESDSQSECRNQVVESDAQSECRNQVVEVAVGRILALEAGMERGTASR